MKRSLPLYASVLVSAFVLGACAPGSDPLARNPAGPTVDPGGTASASESGSDGSGGSGSGGADRVRLRARLSPIIAVDASGQARSEDSAGTARDRFDAQVEVARADFAALGIDAADGFADEVVRLVVSRAGTRVFAVRLRFSEDRPADITFEVDIRGPAAPELREGDVARVNVNGRATLRGTFQRD